MDVMIASHSDMMMRGYLNTAPTLCASDWKEPQLMVKEGDSMEAEKQYIVRRLTPN